MGGGVESMLLSYSPPGVKNVSLYLPPRRYNQDQALYLKIYLPLFTHPYKCSVVIFNLTVLLWVKLGMNSIITSFYNHKAQRVKQFELVLNLKPVQCVELSAWYTCRLHFQCKEWKMTITICQVSTVFHKTKHEFKAEQRGKKGFNVNVYNSVISLINNPCTDYVVINTTSDYKKN